MPIRPKIAPIFDAEPEDATSSDPVSIFAVIVGTLDIISCATLVLYVLLWPNAPIERLIGTVGVPLAALIVLLFAVTGLPGLVLGMRDRAPRTALSLALAFPIGFMLLYGGLTAAAASFG